MTIVDVTRRIAELRISHLASVTALLAAGCGESVDAGNLTMEAVAGVYQATTFESADADGVVDQLAEGASIDLTLSANGSTSGRLFVPDGDPGGGDFVADLAGTWTLTGPLVRLEHPTDSFLRDTGFLYNDGELRGERTSLGVTITVVLTR
jgi:hypothetical protein